SAREHRQRAQGPPRDRERPRVRHEPAAQPASDALDAIMAKPSMPKWRPAPAALVARFTRAVADLPKIENRNMFRYPAIFLHGNMVAGLFQDAMIVRLSEDDRDALAAIPGAARFEPMPGRPMREDMVLPASI